MVLAFIFPGLGHFYLRKWVRGLLWLGLLFMLSVVFVVTGAIDPVTQLSLDAFSSSYQSRPTEVTIGRSRRRRSTLSTPTGSQSARTRLRRSKPADVSERGNELDETSTSVTVYDATGTGESDQQ